MNVVIIGAGNLATNLAYAIHSKGHDIRQVYSRTYESAYMLAKCFDTEPVIETERIVPDADIYILSVSDKALAEVASKIYIGREDCLFVHTAGSMPMDVLPAKRRGVFYPMQSFSKQRIVDFSDIPIFLEVSDLKDKTLVADLANSMSDKVYWLSSAERQFLHLAAVFASNFSNHCYRLSEKILQEHGIPFEVMLPLIDEVTQKVHVLPPKDAQTGPASRQDNNVINKHIQMLSGNPDLQNIYELMSKSIINDKL